MNYNDEMDGGGMGGDFQQQQQQGQPPMQQQQQGGPPQNQLDGVDTAFINAMTGGGDPGNGNFQEADWYRGFVFNVSVSTHMAECSIEKR